MIDGGTSNEGVKDLVRRPHVAACQHAAGRARLADRRAANMRLFAADLRSTGELRDDLADNEVADLVWSTNAAEF